MRSYFRVPFTHAPPLLSESLEQAILYTAMILCRLGLQIVDREMSAIKSTYVFFFVIIIIIYISHQIIYLYNYMIIHLLAKSNSLLPQSPNVTFKH